MTKVDPFIRCSDYWPGRVPPRVLSEYKALLDEGQITKPKVLVNKSAGTALITYQANQPQEWIMERLHDVLYQTD